MMTRNISNTDALRHELIRDYFENVLLGSCPAFKTKVNKRLIESIIVEKAKGAAFRKKDKHKYLEGCCSKPIINLRNNIWKYYKAVEAHKDQENFDNWFFATANKFIEDCERAKGGTVTFGNAQKIINITLKHLYAYADVTKLDHFKFCHLTLDSYTYGAYYRKEKGFYEDIKCEKVKTCWTKLSESEYRDCQEYIRKHFSSSPYVYKDGSGYNLTPFEAEFIIWPKYNCN